MSRYAKDVNKYLVAIKKGDKSKFQQLFDLTANHLLGVAVYYLHDRSYCEDVVSTVYEKIFKYIHTYNEGGDGYNWMCKIVKTTAYDVNNALRDEIPLENVLPSYGSRIAELVYDVSAYDEHLDLTIAIDKLAPIDREMIYSYYYFDRPYQKIAQEMNLTKSTVKKRMDKILKQLKKFLE